MSFKNSYLLFVYVSYNVFMFSIRISLFITSWRHNVVILGGLPSLGRKPNLAKPALHPGTAATPPPRAPPFLSSGDFAGGERG
jgi:hypothetical protein